MSIVKMLQSLPTVTNDTEKRPSRYAAQKLANSPCQNDTAASALAWRDIAVEDRANALLQSSPYHPVRRLMCEACRRVLIVRGHVPSFYMKQLAQTALRNLLDDGWVIDNRVEVEQT